MKEDKLLEEIKNIYQIMHGQLLFMESKNGGLLVFNVAMITILESTNVNVGWLNGFVVIGLLISCIIEIYSFAPLSYRCKNITAIDYWNDSLIYFRNIAKYDAKDAKIYIQQLCKSLAIDEETLEGGLVFSYAKEIIMLSQIIVVKNNVFRYSEIPLLFALISFIVGVALKI